MRILASPIKSQTTIVYFSEINAERICIVWGHLSDKPFKMYSSGIGKVLICCAFSLSLFGPGIFVEIILQNISEVMLRICAFRPKLITIACYSLWLALIFNYSQEKTEHTWPHATTKIFPQQTHRLVWGQWWLATRQIYIKCMLSAAKNGIAWCFILSNLVSFLSLFYFTAEKTHQSHLNVMLLLIKRVLLAG